MLNNKRRVICLVMQWASVHGERLQEEGASLAFLEVVCSSHVTCTMLQDLFFFFTFKKTNTFPFSFLSSRSFSWLYPMTPK